MSQNDEKISVSYTVAGAHLVNPAINIDLIFWPMSQRTCSHRLTITQAEQLVRDLGSALKECKAIRDAVGRETADRVALK